jgi:WS/DGAT/MGAT family acyltransferase
MNTLSGLDALFLYLETPQTPMHIGSFCLYALPSGFEGSWHPTVQQHLGARLPDLPVFTRQLDFMPLNLGHPAWAYVPPTELDLDFHIRVVKHPSLKGSRQPTAALTQRQAEAICAQLHGQLLDRNRPLWELHVFEHILGPQGQRYTGIYSKVHHAALDGEGGAALTRAMLDQHPHTLSQRPRRPKQTSDHSNAPAAWSTAQKIGDVLGRSLSQYGRLLQALPAATRSVGSTLLQQIVQRSGDQVRWQSPLPLAPLSPFNRAIGQQRRFATACLPFAPCHDMANQVGGSFNDIILWLCSSALRRYLTQRGVPVQPLLAAMPISLREAGNPKLNTQASMTVVELATSVADPMQRLQTIMQSNTRVKQARLKLKDLIPTDYPSLLAPWLIGGLARTAFEVYRRSGLSARLPMMANLVISNVAGPPQPLYLAGAKLLTYYPLSIVIHGLALNITLQTYAGQVFFGLIADRHAVPDAQVLADALYQAYKEACELLHKPRRPGRKRTNPEAVRASAESAH